MGKVLSSQGTGYYPSCIQSGSQIDSPFYLDLTIEQGMALYWRTRRWRVDASGSFYSDGRGSPESPIVYSGGGELTQYTPVGSEEDLVCLGGSEYGFFGDINVQSEAEFVEVFYGYTSGYKTDLKFFPSFSLNTIYIGSSPAGTPAGEKVGSVRLIFNGYTIAKDLYTNDTGASGDVLIDFTCIEYWSYGGTWNTSTGEPL